MGGGIDPQAKEHIFRKEITQETKEKVIHIFPHGCKEMKTLLYQCQLEDEKRYSLKEEVTR